MELCNILLRFQLFLQVDIKGLFNTANDIYSTVLKNHLVLVLYRTYLQASVKPNGFYQVIEVLRFMKGLVVTVVYLANNK